MTSLSGFHRDRREHGGASQRLDADQLARLTEERGASPPGSTPYDPDEVPPANGYGRPQPEDITQNENWQEERGRSPGARLTRGELGTVDERHPFPAYPVRVGFSAGPD